MPPADPRLDKLAALAAAPGEGAAAAAAIDRIQGYAA
jgi:hypothetical protein